MRSGGQGRRRAPHRLITVPSAEVGALLRTPSDQRPWESCLGAVVIRHAKIGTTRTPRPSALGPGFAVAASTGQQKKLPGQQKKLHGDGSYFCAQKPPLVVGRSSSKQSKALIPGAKDPPR